MSAESVSGTYALMVWFQVPEKPVGKRRPENIMHSDPIADMLTRIRNGVSIERPFVDVPY